MEKNKVLKISTAGSVDDGKSTLIGRILYDTNSLKRDILKAIQDNSKKKGYDYLDFALATDGLVTEREQGITIDVAHIYFSTPKRSYIIADTPGHEEYTRNMITGASSSNMALMLIDARNGVVEQTKRHFFIYNLLRTKELIVAINKMDLVDFDESIFNTIIKDFKKLVQAGSFKGHRITFIPISALHGDNVVNPSKKTDWYKGKPLMQHLEDIQFDDIYQNNQARFQVQTVIRPKVENFHDFRGYAGKLKGGQLSIGDKVVVLPSKMKSKIKSINFFNQKYKKASNGSSITITLENDLNVSRGDLIVKQNEMTRESKEIKAIIGWMDNTPMMSSSIYQLQHGVKSVKSKIKSIDFKINTDSMGAKQEANELQLNDLGWATIQLAKPLHFDNYDENKDTGAFILIDTKTNTTAGVGFIQNPTTTQAD